MDDQLITDRYAIYNADCMDVMTQFPSESIHLSVYSPPFGGLYHYSSSERDLSNARDYDEFFEHYGYIIAELSRLTMPGRITAVHCMDVPTGNSGKDALTDFPGDIIRAHKPHGFDYIARYHIWKEPLGVRNRTLAKNLAHKTIVDDSSRCSVASADYLLVFRRRGDNPTPIAHPTGLTEYAGERQMPAELLPYRNWTGKQTENRFSHWIWRQYASAFWDDVRIGRVLQLWSNPGERVLTPFMGVGSEVYEAVKTGRFGVGIELKSSYYRQAVKNLRSLDNERAEDVVLFEDSPA